MAGEMVRRIIMLDKDKIKRALQDFGLSTKRCDELSDHLKSYDFEEDPKPKKKKLKELDLTTTVDDFQEVVKY